MIIQNRRKELTKLIENLKEHSEYLSSLETLPVLEINVILTKVGKLYEKVAVLKHLAELDAESIDDEITAEELIETEDDEPKETEEIVQLEELVAHENEAIDAMLEASMDAIGNEITVEEPEEVIMNVVIDEVEETELEEEGGVTEFDVEVDEPTHVEEELNDIQELEIHEEVQEGSIPQPNEVLLDQLLEEAKQEEKAEVVDQSLVEKLEAETELSSKPDINEALSKEDSSVSSQLQKQPIIDLMSAIGLNERYLYSNELFDGDMQEFRNAIKMLNEFNNGDEAKAFFESGLRSTYGWEDDNTLAHALFGLVERRYL